MNAGTGAAWGVDRNLALFLAFFLAGSLSLVTLSSRSQGVVSSNDGAPGRSAATDPGSNSERPWASDRDHASTARPTSGPTSSPTSTSLAGFLGLVASPSLARWAARILALGIFLHVLCTVVAWVHGPGELLAPLVPIAHVGQADVNLGYRWQSASIFALGVMALPALGALAYEGWKEPLPSLRPVARLALAWAGFTMMMAAEGLPTLLLGTAAFGGAVWPEKRAQRVALFQLQALERFAIVLLALAGIGLFWSLGGQWGAGAYASDVVPRVAVLCETSTGGICEDAANGEAWSSAPSESDALKSGPAWLSMRAPWGAQVHLDGGSHPLEGLDGESLRAPFAGVVVNAGVHALRIVLGGDEEDVTLRHVTMKAGQRYALVLTGATLSMASLDEQQTLALSEGTPLLDEPWRRAPHRRTKLLLVVVLAGMSLGSLVMLWGRAVALLLRTERNKAFGSWLLASLLWVWVGGGAAYCRLAAAVPGGRVVVAGVAAALGLATLGLGLRGSLRAHRVFVSLAQAGAAWAVVTYVLVGGLAVGGLLLVQSAVLLVAGSAGNMQANSRGYAAALAAFTLSPLAGALVPGGTSGRGALPGMTGMTAEVVGTVPLGLLGVALFGSWIYARHQGFRDSVAGGSP